MGKMGKMSIQKLREQILRNPELFLRIPSATYRVQLNFRFKFKDLRDLLDYLWKLGITDIYTSPYLKAKKGSTHGYDVVDHSQINPEIGTWEEYEELVKALRERGMGQVMDIVPNHMGIGSENKWWMDLLENGPSSRYSSFFDINWKPIKRELENKILLPILGDQYGRVLDSQEITLSFEEGGFYANYYDHKLPIDPKTYSFILSYRIEELMEELGEDHPDYQELLSILTAISYLPSVTETDRNKIAERYREKEIIKRRIWELYQRSPQFRAFLDKNVEIFNGEKGNPRSFDLLDTLLSMQPYRPSFWRVATEEINYRRFFDVNDLAAIRVEDPQVFFQTHHLIFKLIRLGYVTGLRVDHVDGLYDPEKYLKRLQKSAFINAAKSLLDLNFLEEMEEDKRDEALKAVDEELSGLFDELVSRGVKAPFYVIGEKILVDNEVLPKSWALHGTTGYDFLYYLNELLVDPESERAFTRFYQAFTGSKESFRQVLYKSKRLITETTMSAEVNVLGHYLERLSEKDRYTRDFTLNSLTTGLETVISCFPVYRTYTNSYKVSERDRVYIKKALNSAREMDPSVSFPVYEFIEKVLTLDFPEYFSEDNKKEWLHFVMRFQQLTGPITAKGMEDTAFYRYNRLISLNEVGGNPNRFGTKLENFHKMNLQRLRDWPFTMNTTSTHDTKRSEDVRARINVLSEIPDEWKIRVQRWSKLNAKRVRKVGGKKAPSKNEEYFIYQTLVGAYPLDKSEVSEFKERLKRYMIKALREAKVNSSWINPDLDYERAVLDFLDDILKPSPQNMFLRDFLEFQGKIAFYGALNSLTQVILKITSPGVPDFYQGTELWDFSLVDPDNRRPVDFEKRRRYLEEIASKVSEDLGTLISELLSDWKSGKVKMYLIYKALNFRRDSLELFLEGEYIPLYATPDEREHVISFARRLGDKVAVSVAPRFLTNLVSPFQMPLGVDVWGEGLLILPDDFPKEYLNVLTGEKVSAITLEDGRIGILLAEIFKSFPVALLRAY